MPPVMLPSPESAMISDPSSAATNWSAPSVASIADRSVALPTMPPVAVRLPSVPVAEILKELPSKLSTVIPSCAMTSDCESPVNENVPRSSGVSARSKSPSAVDFPIRATTSDPIAGANKLTISPGRTTPSSCSSIILPSLSATIIRASRRVAASALSSSVKNLVI